MTKDVDFAIITPVGSKDRIPREVIAWLSDLDARVREERMPGAWRDQYRAAYESWKRGESVPLNGTAIKGWAILSPAQQQNIISANILTVEDLAQVNDEASRRIGMGAIELRDKAIAWLKSATSSGVVTQENAALKSQVRTLEAQVKSLTEMVEGLKVENEALTKEKETA